MAIEQSDAYVIAPSGADEAAEVLRGASEAARRGTKVQVGVTESPYDGYVRKGLRRALESADILPEFDSEGGTILLSHGRMRSVLEVSKSDLLAVVQGGVRLGELAAAAAREGLHFPHRPEIDTTVARMVMDGTIFPTDGGFGALREYILSLELVTPAGWIVRFGSRAVKDVGGYELIGFLLGRGGRCGFISSVTLRLLPEPGCRAFVAVTGEVRTLKALAHNARSDYRLSSTLIYEPGAAAIIAARWRAALEKRGKTLPPVLEPGGKALLIGEMQGLERAVEDRLHVLAGTDAMGGASFTLLDEELFDISKEFLAIAFDEPGDPSPVVHLSYDGGAIEPPEGSLVYRSLYPERVNAVVPVEGAAAGSRPIEALETDPVLCDFLAGLVGTLRRERVYLVERREDLLLMIRVSSEELLGLVKDDDERVARAKALHVLDEKVIGAFDPGSIMMP